MKIENARVTPITQEITQSVVDIPRGLKEFPALVNMSTKVRNTYVSRTADMFARGYDRNSAWDRVYQTARTAGHDPETSRQLATYAVTNAAA